MGLLWAEADPEEPVSWVGLLWRLRTTLPKVRIMEKTSIVAFRRNYGAGSGEGGGVPDRQNPAVNIMERSLTL